MRRRPTSFPKVFNANESAKLLALLDHGRRYVEPYNGEWKADWLLCQITDEEWQVRTPSTRLVNDAWVGAEPISWRVLLADRSKLTDARNLEMRTTVQRASFLVRHLPTFGINSISAHKSWAQTLKIIVQWLYINAKIYEPRVELFRRVDGKAVADFIHLFSIGGVAWVLGLPGTTLSIFYKEALGTEVPGNLSKNLFNVPKRDRDTIVEWLTSCHIYEQRSTTELPYINRTRLAALLGVDANSIKSDKFNAFLRQFEPHLLARNSNLLLAASAKTAEYPSHRTPTIDDVASSSITLLRIEETVQIWEQLFRLRRHLPEALPSTERIQLSLARQIARRNGEEGLHTPWVPLKTALAYTTESLRWIVTWGDELVDFYLRSAKLFIERDWFNIKGEPPHLEKRRKEKRDKWVIENLPDRLKELNISGWGTVFTQGRHEPFNQFRASPFLNDALEVLIGAVAIVIGITKPIRITEVLTLRRDCVKFVRGDGYWIDHILEKTSAGDTRLDTTLPIPAITARAIRLIGKLGDGLARLTGDDDKYAAAALFYTPVCGRPGTFRARMLDRQSLEHALDRFCDYVALPVDEFGRRWYLRPHELRKSFLITFFWCFKFSSLDAARWIAGHSSVEHIYAYIEANFPGEELPQLEASYAAKQLMDFSSTRTAGETENVEALYDAVCEHFQVTEINAISENDLSDWLTLAFTKGAYRIHPYLIESSDDMVKISIAFDIERGTTNDKSKNENKRNSAISSVRTSGTKPK